MRVDILSRKYAGQKLIAPVSRSAIATMPRIVATMPDRVPVINNIPIKTAMEVLITLSVVPTFLFMLFLRCDNIVELRIWIV